jgi:hypothetical protein
MTHEYTYRHATLINVQLFGQLREPLPRFAEHSALCVSLYTTVLAQKHISRVFPFSLTSFYRNQPKFRVFCSRSTSCPGPCRLNHTPFLHNDPPSPFRHFLLVFLPFLSLYRSLCLLLAAVIHVFFPKVVILRNLLIGS